MFFANNLYIVRRGTALFIGMFFLFYAVAKSHKRYRALCCKGIHISVLPVQGQSLLTSYDISAYLAEEYTGLSCEALFREVGSLLLEKVLSKHAFVKFCSVNKTWRGFLKITILPKLVLARAFCCDELVSFYISEAGQKLPLLAVQNTPRVVLLSGASRNLCMPGLCLHPSLVSFLQAIYQDPFWRAQITHVAVDQHDELVLSTQLSIHKVYFGKSHQVASKMEKLKIFYKTILAYKSVDSYRQVTVKFDNQIVCE